MSEITITASMVNELRAKTGAGMMDCKKALVEAEGNIDKSIEILRLKGLATAEKRAGRQANQGMVLPKVSKDNKRGVIVHLSCETDFVAKNDEFINMVNEFADTVLNMNDTEKQTIVNAALEASKVKDTDPEAAREKAISGILNLKCCNETLESKLKGLIGKIGENMQLENLVFLDVDPQKEAIHTYSHLGGKVGVLLTATIDGINPYDPKITQILQELVLHIAFAKPVSISRDQVPAIEIEKERAIQVAKAKESGKPDEIVTKMVEGSINKFLKDIVLLEQSFIKDEKITVQQWIEDQNKALNAKITITNFNVLMIGSAV